MNEPKFVLIHYVGGPYDGSKEHIDIQGKQVQQSFTLPHVTDYCMHVYRCPFWDGGDEAICHHESARPRPEPAV